MCQAEDTDLIMSSLAGLGPMETTAGSRRSALLVTATASGRYGPDEPWMAAHTPLGSISHNLSTRKEKVKELPVFG